jgi:hypothetical protein
MVPLPPRFGPIKCSIFVQVGAPGQYVKEPILQQLNRFGVVTAPSKGGVYVAIKGGPDWDRTSDLPRVRRTLSR